MNNPSALYVWSAFCTKDDVAVKKITDCVMIMLRNDRQQLLAVSLI